MSYIVLARKYRPQTFLEIYAQDHVTTIIRNALESRRIAHAYLFSGPRGVGKTSLARILAKSLNCIEGPTSKPCNVCSNCREITSGTASDVIEIDGASNTGVDDIRELQRELLYAPSQSKYKIYIIDEVHMLSKNAFNALLKTLEEPPENVIFIFATTEPHKVLATIVSRCQRFDFKRIPIEAIVERLKYIVNAENINIDSESLYLIARKADGGMRDALSLMDQVLSYCTNDIKIDKVREIFGILPNQVYQTILNSIADHDTTQMILELHSIFEMGIDVSELLNDIMEFCRIIIMIKLKVATPEINPDELYCYEEIAPRFSLDELMYIITSLMNVKTEIRSSTNPYFVLEVALIRLSKMDEMQDLAAIIQRLESGSAAQSVSLPVQNLPSPKRQSVTDIPAPKPSSPVNEAPPAIEGFDEKSLKQNWERLVNRLRKESSLSALALKTSEIKDVSANGLVLNPDTPNNYKLLLKHLDILQQIITELFKTKVRVTLNEPKALPIEEVKIIPINQIIEENPILSKLAEITKSTIEPG